MFKFINKLPPYLTSSINLNRLQQFHKTIPINAGIKYVRNENVYFKKIYSDDLQFQRLEPLFNNEKIKEDENISSFDNLVNTTEISNNRLVPYLNKFTDSLKDKDIDSLIFVLNRLRESKFKSMSSTVHHLISFIDLSLKDYLEKEEKITNEKFEMLFQIALLFDEIGLQNWSKFICRLSSKALDNINLFENKENLLRLCYIMNLNRLKIDDDKAILIELQAMKFFYLNELNLKEMGIICLSFHKTKTKFQTKLIEQIAEKLNKSLEEDSVDDTFCIVSILKGIFSSEFNLDIKLIDNLLDSLLKSKYSNDFLILSKLLSIKKRYKSYNEQLINQILESFIKQDLIRIKELSRLLLNLLYFGVELNAKQIGKFNEQFEHQKSNYALYRNEYFLSVYALASHGLIRKEEIYNIFQPEFLNIIKTKYIDSTYYFLNLNNILKLYGDSNYRNIALKDKDLVPYLKNFNPVTSKEVYNRFKKFENYSSKLYITYLTLKEQLEDGRVNFAHVMPGTKYPNIIITREPTQLKDYQFDVSLYSVVDTFIVRVLSNEFMCDKNKQRMNGFIKLENDLLKQMGFKIIELENNQISHKPNELKIYLEENVINKLE